jgi:hypothetical protein
VRPALAGRQEGPRAKQPLRLFVASDRVLERNRSLCSRARSDRASVKPSASPAAARRFLAHVLDVLFAHDVEVVYVAPGFIPRATNSLKRDGARVCADASATVAL